MIDLDNHRYYNNRELTWLDYNNRVLCEVEDQANPLLERLLLLGISQNNLDGFIKVRMAKIVKRAKIWPEYHDAMGLSYADQLTLMIKKIHAMARHQYRILNQDMLPKLRKYRIHLLHIQDLTTSQKQYIDEYFRDQLFPSIVPMAVDVTHPFPFIKSGEICMVILLKKPNDDRQYFAMIPIALNFPRIIKIPSNVDNDFILQEDVIKYYIKEIFQGATIEGTTSFRLIRDQDIAINDRHTSNLMHEVNYRSKKMKYGRPLQIEFEKNANQRVKNYVQKQFHLNDRDIYNVDGPVDLHFVSDMVKQITGHSNLLSNKYKPFFPTLLERVDIFKAIRKHDLFFHRPYDSFLPVLRFIQEASVDPKVISIKMTLYRVSERIIAALRQAAKNGKMVTVVVELKARGDERANIKWADNLQEVGCQVIYGLIGLKVHCKLAMVVRKEWGGVRRYMHMSTGNYNEHTSKHYVDMDLFTDNPEIGSDATKIFNMLSGFSKPKHLQRLVISPFGIRKFLIHKIKKAIHQVKNGKSATIEFKTNHLSDIPMMKAIYKAALAGVKVNLIVRSVCDIRLNDPRIRKNITVH